MSEFDQVLAFKEMHHDKLIDGRNLFRPCEGCLAFVYSKIDVPVLEIAVPRKVEFSMTKQPSLDLVYTKLEVRKHYGPDRDGFCSYVIPLTDKNRWSLE